MTEKQKSMKEVLDEMSRLQEEAFAMCDSGMYVPSDKEAEDNHYSMLKIMNDMEFLIDENRSKWDSSFC